MSSTLRAFEQTELLSRLLDALEIAEPAFRGRSDAEGEAALSEGLAIVADLYGTLDPIGSPEASAHLGDMCDACIGALGEAYAGCPDALVAAISLVRSVCVALVPGMSRLPMAA